MRVVLDTNVPLATAAAGRADYLVTGDRRDLLPLKRFRTTRIVSVAAFVRTLRIAH